MSDETKSALLKVVEYVGKSAWRESIFAHPNPDRHVEVYGLLDEIFALGVPENEIDGALVAGQNLRK